jgi:hypothetical protein
VCSRAKTDPQIALWRSVCTRTVAFLDLIDHPRLLPLLSEVCGCGGLLDGVPAESPYHGVVRTGGMSGRVVPSEANEQGYLSWHRYTHLRVVTVYALLLSHTLKK